MEDIDRRRKELYDLNTRAWNGEAVFNSNAKLDSSLKKNTGFIKKIRISINQDQYKNILKDIQTLSLEKYLSEIIVSISEGLVKVNKNDDILAAIEIISALHQRFSIEFTPLLLSNFLTGITNQNKDEDKSSKQKNLLRLLMEFQIIGVFRTIKDCHKDLLPDFIIKRYIKNASDPLIICTLKDILNYESLSNSLTIVQIFLKRFHSIIYTDNDLLDDTLRSNLKLIFSTYSKLVWKSLVDINTERNKILKQNFKRSIRTGKILDESTENLSDVESLYEKLKSGAEFLSSTLNIELPELEEFKKNEVNDESVVEVVKSKSANEDEFKVWGDIKEQFFYTIIPTLEELQKLYGDQLNLDQSVKDGERIQNFITKLEKAITDKEIDLLALEFFELNLYNKATKNRLLKFFMEVDNIDNLRFYARFLKITSSVSKDLIDELVDQLDKGFRSQLYRNTINFKNINFFTELIKFKLVPIHIIFHKIRRLTLDLTSTNNMDILSIVYEKSGLFLLNEPEYSELMTEMVDLLKLKQKDDKLNVNDKLGIKNLLYIIEPPQTKVSGMKKPDYTPQQEFIIQLLRYQLNDKTSRTVTDILKSIDWIKQEDLLEILIDVMSKPEMTNFESIPYLSNVLNKLSKPLIMRFLLIRVIDAILENTLRGMELNDYRYNRLRLSQMTFLGSAFNDGLISFTLINDALYKILCFGHPNNQPLPMNYKVSIDSPDNYFRIQLVSVLLKTLKSIVSLEEEVPQKRVSERRMKRLNSLKRKNQELLKVFMVFFQYYILCKSQPIPIELGFRINETFEKCEELCEDKLTRYPSMNDVLVELQSIIKKQGLQKTQATDEEEGDEDDEEDEVIGDADDIEPEAESESDDSDSDDSEEEVIYDDDAEDEEDDDDDDDDDDDEEEDYEEEEEETNKFNPDDDAKFADILDREFKKMVNESFEENQSKRSKQLNPLPSQILKRENPKAETSAGGKGKIAFSLLTKKGKTTDIKNFGLPSDNTFTKNMMKEKEEMKSQRERIMTLVESMDE
ncbi:ARM repeat-containing protein [Hyphopichia burtonii NRRL Y-1933]|uniref:ARM repeat-containing protein n=1 Tax=Hyphopichia burtonii NRRL Y-1933 TaxID=984485 RepID=A0A1E4REW4_9ASCO|nr:ARM repeat-containing protein [Hyphopichia burtonii NRRL Y-1933]ODV65807.1 ARM repeat-containing protein [Hyphopichia burtonii NRRL Y-1933]